MIRYFVFIIFLLGFVLSCKTTKTNDYINPDASAIFSTNPARPFKYGYAYDYRTCEKYFKDRIVDFGIKNGEVIADVGAASGWLDGIYSVLVDSVIFYVQDIDSHYLDQKQLDAVIQHYSNQRLSPQTNTFHLVMGTTEHTNLPDSTFDKIIICNTLHEIPDPHPLIADLSSKLKPGGKVIVLDQFSSIYKTIKHPGCGIDGSLVKDVVENFKTHGFYLTHMKNPENSTLNYLTFEKNESKADHYLIRTRKVESYLSKLDLLNQKKISADSSASISIGLELKSHLDQIHHVFPSLTDYLDDLAEEWVNEKCYANAINVARVKLMLYPQDARSYSYMGYALAENKKYEDAIKWFSGAIQMDENNADYFTYRGDALLKLERYDEALDDYYMVIYLDSTEAGHHFDLGNTYDQMGDYIQTIPHYSKAIELDPYQHEYLWYRGYANYYSNNYEDAIYDFSKAIELDPENWGYYQSRASVKKAMGDKAGYQEDMKKAAEIKSKK